MKSYEKEAFLKSFILFFGIQLVFLSIVIFQYYKKKIDEHDTHIAYKMVKCSYTLKCEEFSIDFVNLDKSYEFNTLYKQKDIAMYFPISSVDTYMMKIALSKQNYIKEQNEIKKAILREYLIYLSILLAISAFFAWYTIRPLREALHLNEEFVKDILHDFNTPVSALKINIKILKKVFGEHSALQRSEDSIESILSLQSNLNYFLDQNKLQSEVLQLNSLIKQRVNYFKTIFPNIKFNINIDNTKIKTNKNAFIRVLDNLLSNAGKYNKEDGYINISLKNNILSIEDSGIGIKNRDKIFDRYYKETNRGIGVGLHIVKKLCDDLNIFINLKSKPKEGTVFWLDLSKIISK